MTDAEELFELHGDGDVLQRTRPSRYEAILRQFGWDDEESMRFYLQDVDPGTVSYRHMKHDLGYAMTVIKRLTREIESLDPASPST